jgi:hypothetical protein
VAISSKTLLRRRILANYPEVQDALRAGTVVYSSGLRKQGLIDAVTGSLPLVGKTAELADEVASQRIFNSLARQKRG